MLYGLIGSLLTEFRVKVLLKIQTSYWFKRMFNGLYKDIIPQAVYSILKTTLSPSVCVQSATVHPPSLNPPPKSSNNETLRKPHAQRPERLIALRVLQFEGNMQPRCWNLQWTLLSGGRWVLSIPKTNRIPAPHKQRHFRATKQAGWSIP